MCEETIASSFLWYKRVLELKFLGKEFISGMDEKAMRRINGPSAAEKIRTTRTQ